MFSDIISSISSKCFVLLVITCCHISFSQSKEKEPLQKLAKQYETELLFSNKKATETLQLIEKKVLEINTKKANGLLQSLKAIHFLKIENEQDSAKAYAKSAYQIHQSLKDSLSLFKDTHTLFEYYYKISQNDSAFFYATKEIELAEKLKHPIFETTAYVDMSDVYYITKQHDKVLDFRKKALRLAEKHQLKKELADIHIKIAQSHLRLSKQRTQKVLDSAIFHGKKALRYAKQAKYNYGIYESTIRLADFLNVNKQHKEALNLIETITDLPDAQRPTDFSFIGPFYYAVILKDNKKYNKAKNIVKQLVSNLDSESSARKPSLYYFLTALYAYNKQPDSTDYAIKQAIIANNANDEIRVNKKIAELQTKYETEKKEQEIKNLTQKRRLEQLEIKDLERQRQILFIFFLIPLTLLFAGGWYVNRKRLKLQLETEQKEYAQQMSELKALRSQMNPHFIFNALNSIQEYIFANEKQLASSYLVKFSRLIRIYLDQSQSSEISLSKEIEALNLYLQLENNRFGNTLKYTIDVDKALHTEMIYVPPLFIQPYVENAIKHGLMNKKGNKKLDVNFVFNEADNLLEVKITDNGIGRKAAMKHIENRPYKSFSTKASNDRVELMNLHRAKKIQILINDLENIDGSANGTEVIITIPL